MGPSPASAQWGAVTRWETYEGRFALHVNAAYQASSEEFRQLIQQRAYGEDARFDVTNRIAGTAFIDAGGHVRVWRQLSIGATYTELTNLGRFAVTGTVPHPTEFNNDRSVQAEPGTLPHRQRATHIVASWLIPVSTIEKLDVSIFGGPSFFNVTQGVVTSITISEAGPPFTTVNIDQVSQAQHTRNAWGGHVGADFSYMWTTHAGIGGFVRFAGGSVEVPFADGMISLSVGGFQSGGGLRLRF